MCRGARVLLAHHLLNRRMKRCVEADIIEFPMRVSRLFWIAPLAAALAVTVSAQDGASLPSAPSATLEQQRPPAPPPQAQTAPAPEKEAQGAKPQQPLRETLDPKMRPKPVQQVNPAAQPEQAAQAQTTPPRDKNDAKGSSDNPFSIVVPVNEVNVVFVVTDKHNHYVKDLKEVDFRILDNNKPPAN